jgi:hypothetical protein
MYSTAPHLKDCSTKLRSLSSIRLPASSFMTKPMEIENWEIILPIGVKLRVMPISEKFHDSVPLARFGITPRLDFGSLYLSQQFHSETRPGSHYLLLSTQLLLLRLYTFVKEWDKDALRWNCLGSTVKCQAADISDRGVQSTDSRVAWSCERCEWLA